MIRGPGLGYKAAMRAPDRLAPLFASAALLLSAPRALAADEVELHLITMGPADHLYTSGGHAALMVAALRDGQPDPTQTTIYNFGDADYDDPSLKWRFLRGDAQLRLTMIGTLQEVVNDYGIRQGREVWRQRLNLTPAQAQAAAARLATLALEENRYYRHHYHEATCTTKIRDLLDEVTEGALTRALAGQPAPFKSARDYQPIIWAKHHAVAIAGDLFMGRRHDLERDKLWWLVDVPQMRAYLQEVMVPVEGGATAPLAEPPTPLIEFVGAKTTSLPSIMTPLVATLWALLLGLGARRAARRLPEETSSAGLWLMVVGSISGVIGAVIALLMIFSTMPELAENENLLVFPATDLLLVGIGARLRRGPLPARWWRFLAIYGWARVGLTALVIGLHAAGIFFQRPRLWIALSGLFAGCLVALARRARAGAQKSV